MSPSSHRDGGARGRWGINFPQIFFWSFLFNLSPSSRVPFTQILLLGGRCYVLLFLLARWRDERPQCFRAGRAVGPRQRETRKTSFLTSFSHIFHWLSDILERKRGKLEIFCQGPVFYEEAFCFYFSGFASCAFQGETATAVGFLVKCLSSLLSSTYIISMRKACGLDQDWKGEGGHWSMLAHGQVVLIFITFQILQMRRTLNLRFLFSEGISHALVERFNQGIILLFKKSLTSPPKKNMFTKFVWKFYNRNKY